MWALISSVLLAVAGSFASRMLVGLGITIGTFAGMDALVNAAVGQIQLSYGGIGGDVLSILNLAGFGQSLGIMLGAFVTKAAMKSLSVFAGSLS